MIKDDLNRQLNTQKKNEWDKFKAKEKDYDLLYEECKKDLIEVGIEDDLRSISEWYSEQTGELFKCETKIDEKKNNFFRSDSGGTFCLHFWNLH